VLYQNSWKPSRREGSLYCLVGDLVSQEIAFVGLIKVFVAIRSLPLFVPVFTKHTSLAISRLVARQQLGHLEHQAASFLSGSASLSSGGANCRRTSVAAS
jgi:hypothetical protein